MAQILFIGEDTIKDRTVVSGAVDSKYLQQVIWTVQEEHIHTALGSMLYRRLIKGIEEKSLADVESELISTYITNAMVFFVLAELPYVLSFKFHNRNVIKQTTESTETPSMSELAELMNHYKSKAEFFMERMKRFIIQQNTVGQLMEYVTYDGRIDNILPDRRSYKCQFLLPDDGLPGVDLGYGEGVKRLS